MVGFVELRQLEVSHQEPRVVAETALALDVFESLVGAVREDLVLEVPELLARRRAARFDQTVRDHQDQPVLA